MINKIETTNKEKEVAILKETGEILGERKEFVLDMGKDEECGCTPTIIHGKRDHRDISSPSQTEWDRDFDIIYDQYFVSKPSTEVARKHLKELIQKVSESSRLEGELQGHSKGYSSGFNDGKEEGRKSVFDEIKHEQRKLLDGFGHPEDCEICKKPYPTLRT